ncbi:MAG: Ig-like domain-containing protein [Proteobacteria bacterium]|nr:Ig-like domain-containing protein [Pseudomonadota bacterium]
MGACSDDAPAVAEVDTTIDDGPAALINTTSVTFTFHASPADASHGFVCQVDQQQPGECASPFTATTTTEGDHTFSVAAIDLHLQPDPTPAVRTWRLDATPPDTMITRMPAAIDQSATPEFEFTGVDTGGGTLTFECSVDAVGFVACASPTFLDLGEGPHTFEIRAIDGAGNVDPTPAMHAWIVDTSSPDTMITAGPDDASTSGPSPVFTFISTDVTATFECKVDAATFAACTSPLTIAPALADGAHTLEVRAKDTNGVVDPTPATRAWTVDGTAPDVLITMTPPDPSNDSTPTFSFTSTDATATFECQANVGVYGACAAPFTTPAMLPDGINTFRVRAVDPVGNRTATPATFSWIIDTSSPTVTITGAPVASSNDATPTVTFSTTGGPTSILCQVDAGTATPCTSPFTSAALAEGSHTITVTVADLAGNSDMKTAMFAIDLTAPTVAITAVPSPTNDATPSITFATTGATTVTCQLDGGGFAACTSPFTPTTLGDGAHTFDVRAADAVGNTTTQSIAFTIDTVAPTITITSAPPNPTNNATPQFVFTIGGGPATTTCAVDGGAFTACASPYTTPMLLDASHTVTIQAVDVAGNARTASRTFIVDTAPPTVTLTAQPTDPTTDATPSVSFSVAGGAISVQCQIDGGAFAACASPFTAPAQSDGFHTITIRALDDAGNTGTAVAMFTIDTGAPQVTITSSPPNPTNDNTATVAFTVVGAFVALDCQIDAGAFVACTSPFTTAALPDGTHTITVRATDSASNAGSAFKTFQVDTVGPVVTIITPPTNPFNDPTPDTIFQVTGGAISVACSVDGGAFATCASPFTAPMLTEGSHTIVVRALDDVGNPGSATTGAFVVDTIAPPLTLTGVAMLTNDSTPTVTFSSDGSQSGFRCKVDAGVFAACTSPFTATTLLDGTHTITVRAVDAATNFTEKLSTFDVDATPPTVTLTSQPPLNTNDNTPTVAFTTAGSPTLVECQVGAGAFVACTSPFTAAALGEGASSITVRATDAATNTGAATATFTVDTIAPTIAITTTFANPTKNPRPPIAFTATGATASLQCQTDALAFVTCTSPFTPSGNLSDGPHTITVRGTDLAGNTAMDSVAFDVDTIAPTVTYTATPTNPSNDTTPTFAFSTGGAPTLVECKVDAGAFAACTSPYAPGTLAEGAHTVTVRVTDAATNTASFPFSSPSRPRSPTTTRRPSRSRPAAARRLSSVRSTPARSRRAPRGSPRRRSPTARTRSPCG